MTSFTHEQIECLNSIQGNLSNYRSFSAKCDTQTNTIQNIITIIATTTTTRTILTIMWRAHSILWFHSHLIIINHALWPLKCEIPFLICFEQCMKTEHSLASMSPLPFLSNKILFRLKCSAMTQKRILLLFKWNWNRKLIIYYSSVYIRLVQHCTIDKMEPMFLRARNRQWNCGKSLTIKCECFKVL